ncbi:MAG: glycosyltransferase family 1 protein [Chloroflexi bacterium]|nr:MAG: glycosyltransferase family 1 protein [Chloroflexota bacterium]
MTTNEDVSGGKYRVGVVFWSKQDGIATVICDELTALGHKPVPFFYQSELPDNVDVIFSFGPYGPFEYLLSRLNALPRSKKPILTHWNTEGIPDLRIPWVVMFGAGLLRAWAERLRFSDGVGRKLVTGRMMKPLHKRMTRFLYFGSYYYAYRAGLMEVLADSSAVYADLHVRHGLPTVVAPWGATRRWYADLGYERDIDVLWMGKRGSKRRSMLLDMVRARLERYGVKMLVVDGEERPFIYDQERTEILNRSKITLNLTRTWYDDNYSRFALAAPNRSLIVSEPLLPHCPHFRPGEHYIAAPASELADQIMYYLAHEDERMAIVERAYQLMMSELSFEKSIAAIMTAVHEARLNPDVRSLKGKSVWWRKIVPA